MKNQWIHSKHWKFFFCVVDDDCLLRIVIREHLLHSFMFIYISSVCFYLLPCLYFSLLHLCDRLCNMSVILLNMCGVFGICLARMATFPVLPCLCVWCISVKYVFHVYNLFLLSIFSACHLIPFPPCLIVRPSFLNLSGLTMSAVRF